MIVGGILVLPGYFLGTCAYTALQQHQLRQSLEATNPQLAAAGAALAETDFVSMEATTTTVAPSATPDEVSAAEAAIAAAKAERDAQLAAFKAAADAYQATVGGQIGQALGRIVVPSIGVDVVMVEGTGKRDLKEGPGHWEETPFPGQNGNFVVSGHRTTYGAPFFKLDDVQVGDEIDLVLPYVVARYTVTRVIIVYPDEVDAVAQRGREQVSLAACHPIYSAKQRIVVQGDLTSFKLIESGS
jgi:LPXTG-site transpeptidase (sortase) family protein